MTEQKTTAAKKQDEIAGRGYPAKWGTASGEKLAAVGMTMRAVQKRVNEMLS